VEAGASADVTFHLHADRTSFTGRDLQRIVEPGLIEVLVGFSASDIRCIGEFSLTGPVRTVGHDRHTVTPAEVTRIGTT